jgi:hypothetical protein
VAPHIQTAIRYLNVTSSGRQCKHHPRRPFASTIERESDSPVRGADDAGIGGALRGRWFLIAACLHGNSRQAKAVPANERVPLQRTAHILSLPQSRGRPNAMPN